MTYRILRQYCKLTEKRAVHALLIIYSGFQENNKSFDTWTNHVCYINH